MKLPYMKIRSIWDNGFESVRVQPYYTGNLAFLTVEKAGRQQNRYNHVADWWIYDNDTGALLSSKFEESNEVKAKRLYEETKNYAEVARQMEVHPTTIRKWLQTGDK